MAISSNNDRYTPLFPKNWSLRLTKMEKIISVPVLSRSI